MSTDLNSPSEEPLSLEAEEAELKKIDDMVLQMGAAEEQRSMPFVRNISDRIFSSIEDSEREAQGTSLRDIELAIPTRILVDRSMTTGEEVKIKEEDVRIPAASVVAVIAGAQLADKWSQLPKDSRETFRSMATQELIKQCLMSEGKAAELKADPVWVRSFLALAQDYMNEGDDELHKILQGGLPPSVLQSNDSFAVEAVPDNEPVQIGVIVSGIIRRLRQLCGEERRKVKDEIRGWEKWKNKIIVPSHHDLEQLLETYRDVRIRYEWYRDLFSAQPEIRESALDQIRKFGGFIKEPEPSEYEELFEKGVMRMIDDGSAYYGLLIDQETVKEHLMQMCGFDPSEDYYKKSVGLPKKSGLGWQLEWNADPHLARIMFQNPEKVAVSVEVAVMREKDKDQMREGRRNAGIAAALKDATYRDPKVEQTYILTRHFQLLEVGLPEQGMKGRQGISRAINLPSDAFIRLLGGCEIGSGKEECKIRVPDKRGKLHKVDLLIRWIYCLAPRKTSLDVIEGRGQRI